MTSLADAHSLVMDRVVVLDGERVALSDALGKRLARAVVADRDLPPANRATAVIRIDPQVALERKTSLRATDIEALKKRDDFPIK